MKIVVTDNGTGSRLWRLDPHERWLIKNGHEVIRHPQNKPITAIEAEWADVAIVEMVLEKGIIDLFHKYHVAVIYEIDDLIEKVTKNHPSHHKLTRFPTIWRTYNCIRKSDAMFASTKPIYNRYGWLMRKDSKFIFPNLLALDYWTKQYQPNTDKDEIRIGWAGSWAHKDDLIFIAPVMKAIVEKYPKVKFVYVGMGGVFTNNSYDKYVYGDDLFEGIPPERREYHEGVDADFWAEKLASLRLDIGIAPVMNNKFSLAKSNIKWQEYSINKIPGVFSDVLYGDTVKNGIDGLVVKNTQKAWIDSISFLVENESSRKLIAENAHERVVKHFNVEQQFQGWFDTVSAIHSRYVARTGGKSSLKE